MARRLVLIGIDAGEFRVIGHHLNQFPTLRRLFETGSVHRLESEGRDLSGSVWATFATGQTPGEHGIYYPMQWDPASMRLRRVRNDWLPIRAFWADLAQRGRAVCTLDASVEPQDLGARGLEVANWGTHNQLDSLVCSRPGLRREILRRFGPSRIGRDNKVALPSNRFDIRNRLVQSAKLRGEIIAWLHGLADWDLFLAVYGEAHRAGHILWGLGETDPSEPGEALLDVYRAIDGSIGRVLEGIDLSCTSIILFGLHGMGHQISYAPLMSAVVDRTNAEFQRISGRSVPVAPRQRSPMRVLRERLPARLQDKVASALPARARDWVVERSVTGGHDWSATPGLALLSDHSGYLRLNIAGRERQGLLAEGGDRQGRYVALLEDHLHSLAQVGSGEPIVASIVSGQTRFPGARAHLLPDLIVNWRENLPWRARVRSDLIGEVPELETGRTGDHREGGFAVICNPRASSIDEPAPPRHIADLARVARAILEDGALESHQRTGP